MSAETASMPAEPSWPPVDADERTTLLGYLDGYRTVLVRKAAGLTQEQLAASLPPSDLTIGGILKHLALVEDIWFQRNFGGVDLPEPWASVDLRADRDWALHSAAHDEPAALVALFDAACRRSSQVVDATKSLDDLSVRSQPDGSRWSLRWILVHLVEEYARHAGHADLIRESLDGATGD